MDAKDTVVNVVKNLEARVEAASGQESSVAVDLRTLLQQRDIPVVTWSHFQNIDAAETSLQRKRSDKQPREKITEIKDLLGAAFGS